LEFDSEKLDLQTIHNWNFRRPHTCHAQHEFAELLNDSLCHGIFKTDFVIFGQKQETNT